MTVKYDLSREERVKLWRAGRKLCEAWYAFGDERQKKLHDQHRGTPTSIVYQMILIRDVFQDLASGELIAFGFQTRPTASDGPVYVPADTFSQLPEDIWRDDEVCASGWRYERVTVRISNAALDDDPVVEEAEEHQHEPKIEDESSRKKAGRKSTYADAALVLDQLFKANPTLIGLSPEKLHPLFSAHWRIVFDSRGGVTPIPSLRTLRTHLARFRRQKSATTGNNETAN